MPGLSRHDVLATTKKDVDGGTICAKDALRALAAAMTALNMVHNSLHRALERAGEIGFFQEKSRRPFPARGE